jgi:hypothetical protein
MILIWISHGAAACRSVEVKRLFSFGWVVTCLDHAIPWSVNWESPMMFCLLVYVSS